MEGWDEDIMDHRSNQEDFAELYDELAQEQLAILQKIARGLTTVEDALYVANSWGLTTEFRRENT